MVVNKDDRENINKNMTIVEYEDRNDNEGNRDNNLSNYEDNTKMKILNH